MTQVVINGGQKLKEFLGKLKAEKKSLKVGFLQTEIAKIAIINEYGAHITVTPKMRAWFKYQGVYLKKSTTKIVIPPRPFMQRTVDQNSESWYQILAKLLPRFEYDATKVLSALGEVVSGNISEMIEEGDFIANSPLTIKRKNGKDKPLVDTGNMAKSVSYKVE